MLRWDDQWAVGFALSLSYPHWFNLRRIMKKVLLLDVPKNEEEKTAIINMFKSEGLEVVWGDN
jgi:hypothetical protein